MALTNQKLMTDLGLILLSTVCLRDGSMAYALDIAGATACHVWISVRLAANHRIETEGILLVVLCPNDESHILGISISIA